MPDGWRDLSRREVLSALAVGGGIAAGYATREDGSDEVIGGVGGGGSEEPGFEVEASTDVPVYYAPTTDELAAPSTTPALVVTNDAGALVATAGSFANYPSISDTQMTQIDTVQVATSVDDLSEPDSYPALAVTAEEGLLIQEAS